MASSSLTASELLQRADEAQSSPPLDYGSRQILQGVVTLLDDWNCATINLNVVAAIALAVLTFLRFTLGKRNGVDWYSLAHSLVTGWGSVLALYLDEAASEQLTGIPEPLRACQCHGPLTSLHRIIPAITMGFSILDLLDGATIGIDFALHGCFTFVVMVFYVQTNVPQIVTPFIVMEMSTIHLGLIRADFFSKTASFVNQCLFAFMFFIFRVVIPPTYYVRLMMVMWRESSKDSYKACHGPFLFPFTMMLGLCFHSLNGFWFYKLIRKMKRKLSGQEGIQANNDLSATTREDKKDK
mmetsp:Transcript_26191/g.60202  ORF Transcript_26191/g.60202 Transcript_26191/m.60202 type:complete len:297 (-) Transcript_26191:105-995(-)